MLFCFFSFEEDSFVLSFIWNFLIINIVTLSPVHFSLFYFSFCAGFIIHQGLQCVRAIKEVQISCLSYKVVLSLCFIYSSN